MRRIVEGIVLRETETKEADKILTVLTKSEGKLTVIARGARRKNSRTAAAAELLAYSEMTLFQRGKWSILDEASTIELFSGVRQDIELLALGSYFADLSELLSQEDVPAPELLSLLLNALYALGTLRRDPEQVKAAFELRILTLSGFAPLLDRRLRRAGAGGAHAGRGAGRAALREMRPAGAGGAFHAAVRGVAAGHAPCGTLPTEKALCLFRFARRAAPHGRRGGGLCGGPAGAGLPHPGFLQIPAHPPGMNRRGAAFCGAARPPRFGQTGRRNRTQEIKKG